MTSSQRSVRPASRERSTPQKRALAALLAASSGFRSAQDLYAELRGRGQNVGLTTVYNQLGALAEAGEVDAVRTETGEVLYRRCATAKPPPPPAVPQLRPHHRGGGSRGRAVGRPGRRRARIHRRRAHGRGGGHLRRLRCRRPSSRPTPGDGQHVWPRAWRTARLKVAIVVASKGAEYDVDGRAATLMQAPDDAENRRPLDERRPADPVTVAVAVERGVGAVAVGVRQAGDRAAADTGEVSRDDDRADHGRAS